MTFYYGGFLAHVRQNDPCVYCLRSPVEQLNTLDHIVPQAQGGGTRDNLAPACERCNHQKDSKKVVLFLLERSHKDKIVYGCLCTMCKRHKKALQPQRLRVSMSELVGGGNVDNLWQSRQGDVAAGEELH